MSSQKILSISIAAYNVSSTLQECLDPFLKSDVLDDLDIMIVNDGSSDNTVEIAQKYVDKYPNSFRLIDKENGGWGSTVNRGIEQAIGKFFRQLDGDDYYKPENMSSYISFLKKTDADMVLAPYIEFNDSTGEVITESNCNPGCEYKKTYNLADISTMSPFMHSMTIRTELLKDNVRVTEHCFYTDTEFILKCCNVALTVAFFDKPIYCYRRASAGQSMSLSGLEKHYNDQTTVISVLLDYLRDNVTRAEVRAIYDNLLLGTCFWQYLVLLYISVSSKHKRDLIMFDQILKEKNSEYYNKIGLPAIRILRKTHFLGYALLATHQTRKDKRFDSNGCILY